MDAHDHLRNVLGNLNRKEHWDDGLRYAVRDAEEFLAEEFFMVPEQPDPLARIPSDPPRDLMEALEVANELASRSSDGVQIVNKIDP